VFCKVFTQGDELAKNVILKLNQLILPSKGARNIIAALQYILHENLMLALFPHILDNIFALHTFTRFTALDTYLMFLSFGNES